MRVEHTPSPDHIGEGSVIGKRFGMLTILSVADPVPNAGGQIRRRYHCLCDCGKERTVYYFHLKSGQIQSCGCKKNPLLKPVDLTGQKIGMVTVVSEAAPRIRKGGSKERRWNCFCDCGNTAVIPHSHLVKPTGIISCGCQFKRPMRPPVENIVGKRYGKLTVLSLAEPVIVTDGTRKTAWLCKCDCGNELIVRDASIRSGNKKSCGCLKHERRTDLTGKTYGRLTVIEEAEPIRQGKRDRRWLCRCSCGNEVIVRQTLLTSGGTQSCGCSRAKKTIRPGQRFGRLTAICEAGSKVSARGTEKTWLCRCDCGREVIVRRQNLVNTNTRSCGCLRSRKKKYSPKRNSMDLTGKKYGLLTVLSEAERRKKKRRWNCLCDCGNEKVVDQWALTSGMTKSCGCLRRRKHG